MVDPTDAAEARGGLLAGAALGFGAALVANVALWALSLVLPGIESDFAPLAGPSPAIFFTTIGSLGAVAAYALLRKVAERPDRVFRRVAATVLVISFAPDVWLLGDAGSAAFPGATVPGVAVLMVMHVAAAVALVWGLTMRSPTA